MKDDKIRKKIIPCNKILKIQIYIYSKFPSSTIGAYVYTFGYIVASMLQKRINIKQDLLMQYSKVND